MLHAPCHLVQLSACAVCAGMVHGITFGTRSSSQANATCTMSLTAISCVQVDSKASSACAVYVYVCAGIGTCAEWWMFMHIYLSAVWSTRHAHPLDFHTTCSNTVMRIIGHAELIIERIVFGPSSTPERHFFNQCMQCSIQLTVEGQSSALTRPHRGHTPCVHKSCIQT